MEKFVGLGGVAQSCNGEASLHDKADGIKKALECPVISFVGEEVTGKDVSFLFIRYFSIDSEKLTQTNLEQELPHNLSDTLIS